MILTDEDVIQCLERAKEIIEQYEMYALHPRDLRSIDDLEWICLQYLNRPVEIFDLRIEAQDRVVRGAFVAMSDGSYKVFRLADLGERERRFVTCKELFHVILDSDQCRNMDLLAHLEEAQSSFSIEDSHPNSAVKNEILAEIGAMEFLFPYAKRVQELAGVSNKGTSEFFEAIAHKYGVPQVFVEEYLSERFMSQLDELQW